MLSSWGQALSQGDRSDFDPGRKWEATPPGYSTCKRAWKWLAPHHRATTTWTYYGSPEKLEKYGNAGRCSHLWEKSEMGMQRKTGSRI